ncbi:hypothetical protein [Streptomyces sp. NPDC001717]|uniref:hypothetical protein n=1 Tax=Streptomyces sp. NPDC001717 TaxID=3364604 RepID=UPI00367BE765
MDLDVLYEIDVPKPWSGTHPHGRRAAEQRAYREAAEQIRLADRMGFRTVWAVEHHRERSRDDWREAIAWPPPAPGCCAWTWTRDGPRPSPARPGASRTPAT